MIALILFLSTTAFIPVYSTLLVVPLLLLRNAHLKKSIPIFFSRKEIVGCLLILLATIFILFPNIFFGPVLKSYSGSSFLEDLPYILLLLISIVMAKFISLKDLKIIQWLIIIEIFIGVLEYISGVPTFFRNTSTFTELPDSDILYRKKVFGFSSNSSVLATKIIYLFTIVIMQIKNYNKVSVLNKISLFMILIGLVITFNRTALITIVVSFLIFFIRNKRVVLSIVLPTLMLLFIKQDFIYEQLTRGRGTIDYSGRDQIFSYFFGFWKENMLLGNMGKKVLWDSGSSIWHAHNSYLEFLSSNGLIVSIFFILAWIFIFGKNTYIVIPILVYSTFQYGFLWGMTFYDFIIFAIIYTYSSQIKELELNKKHTLFKGG